MTTNPDRASYEELLEANRTLIVRAENGVYRVSLGSWERTND